MILAGGSVHVIILEHPETCSFVQFSITALRLCLWTRHFSNPEILPMILRHSGSECCVGCGSSCKEQFLCQGCFWDPSWRAVTQNCWDVSRVGHLWTSQVVCPCHTVGGAFLLEMPAPGWHSDPRGCGGVPGDPGNTQGQSQAGPGLCWSWSSYSRARSSALVWFSLPSCSFSFC